MPHPYQDAGRSVEERASDLLARMTFEEKAAQMHALWLLLSEDGEHRPRQDDFTGGTDPAAVKKALGHGLGQVVPFRDPVLGADPGGGPGGGRWNHANPEHNLRGLSLPDDHFAVWLTTIFIMTAGLALVNEAFIIPMYMVSIITFIYIPLGKIRHCLYFFFSRLFFGKFFGRRAVFPHPEAVKGG